MLGLIYRIDICTSLTAHPTEARRRAVLDKLQTTASALAERDENANPSRVFGPLDSSGHSVIELRRALTELWQTDELRASQLTVEDEARNAMYFFDRTISKIVPWLHDDLRRALKSAYPDHCFEIPAFLTYRSWVGGDRDGNPNVTPEVTWQTVVQHKRVALIIYIDMVAQVRRELTQSLRLVPASKELMDSVDSDMPLGLVSKERRA